MECLPINESWILSRICEWMSRWTIGGVFATLVIGIILGFLFDALEKELKK